MQRIGQQIRKMLSSEMHQKMPEKIYEIDLYSKQILAIYC